MGKPISPLRWALRHAKQGVVNTHAHADHTCGNRAVLSGTDAQLVIHEDDADQVRSGKNQTFSLVLGKKPSPKPDLRVKDGDTLAIGRETLQIIHTPGHSPRSICLWGDGNLFTGDTLFLGAVGRTDIAGSDLGILLLSLKELLALPPKTIIRPGHDYGESPVSTLSHEQKSTLI